MSELFPRRSIHQIYTADQARCLMDACSFLLANDNLARAQAADYTCLHARLLEQALDSLITECRANSISIT